MHNVIADGLTRGMQLSSVEIPTSKRYMFLGDRIPGMFWLGGEEMMDAEISGDIESEEGEGYLRLGAYFKGINFRRSWRGWHASGYYSDDFRMLYTCQKLKFQR